MILRFALFLAMTLPAGADPSAPPLIASTETEAQLSAIVRIRNSSEEVNGCSAVLIALRLALTAAHCAQSTSIEMEVRPADAKMRVTIPIAQVITHPDYAGPAKIDTAHADLAVLILPRDVPSNVIRPLPLGPPIDLSKTYAIYGYMNPGRQPLKGHPRCKVLRLGPKLLGSDCSVLSGLSGAPLLAGEGWDASVVGIVVAKIVTPVSGVRSLIAEVDPMLLADGLRAVKPLP